MEGVQEVEADVYGNKFCTVRRAPECAKCRRDIKSDSKDVGTPVRGVGG